jgi:hypothetical protein
MTASKQGLIQDKPAQYSAISTGPRVNIFLFNKIIYAIQARVIFPAGGMIKV